MKLEESTADFSRPDAWQHPDYSRTACRRTAPATEDRDVIAWDMEGISLSGQLKPQHAVLYGCSAEVDTPLMGKKLSTREMLEYMIDIAVKNPYALHVGYAFKYDANMIIAGLPERHIQRLWKNGRCTLQFDDHYVWVLTWRPGKTFSVSRRPKSSKRNSRTKISMTVYDFFSFFGMSFIKAMEQLLGDELTDDDREVIAHGKQARGNQSWDDFAEIRHYWEREIILMKRTFEKFRDVMCRAGFPLKEWYGPGALANYINATRGIRTHLVGVQVTGELPPPVHEASKVAFSGGRFELFQAGRIKGPVYAIDINSAYPYALTKLPSFERGSWTHVTNPERVELFGFYRIKFRAPSASPFETRPMPLFWRDNRGLISYPPILHGWYASPEAAIVKDIPGVEILEGWYWETESEEKPWSFLQEMYETRMRLGKKNLMSMPFKLGPNSLYGKYAQTVGWDQKKKLPPKSHALPVAGWVTSYCRAMLWDVIRRDPSSVISVETDSVFTTTDPRTMRLSIGSGLGQWDFKVYDEVIYMQSGMYHLKADGEWFAVKSRGMNAEEFPIEKMEEYLQSLTAGEKWDPIELVTRPRFIGAGAALAMSAPLKAVHTSWRPQKKKMALGDTGKRVHVPGVCSSCRAGISPSSRPHRLIVNTRSDGEMLSFGRKLPWEGSHPDEVQEIRTSHLIESELLEEK
jgi:hypothetical protein